MQPNELSQDIVEQAKVLDSKAIAALFEYYYPKIYRYFYYRVKTNEDAEDLASEVFVKMVKSIKRQTGNFAAWLYMIAKNTLVDYYRREGVKRENTVDNTILETVPDDKKAVDDLFVQDELKNNISRLSEEQQQVILLKFIEGFNNVKIAEIMGKTIGAVKSLQFRALANLRELMKEG